MPQKDYYEKPKYGLPKNAVLDKRTQYFDKWHDKRGKRYFYGRGTNPWSIRQWIEDVQLLTGKVPKNIRSSDKEAKRYMKKYPNAKVWGYSRGARFASRYGGTSFGGFDVGVKRDPATEMRKDDQGGITGKFHNSVVMPISNKMAGYKRTRSGSKIRPRKKYKGSGFTGPSSLGRIKRVKPTSSRGSIYKIKGIVCEGQDHFVKEQGQMSTVGISPAYSRGSEDDIGLAVGIAFFKHVMYKHYGYTYQSVDQLLDPTGLFRGIEIQSKQWDESTNFWGSGDAALYDEHQTEEGRLSETLATAGQWFKDSVFNALQFYERSKSSHFNQYRLIQKTQANEEDYSQPFPVKDMFIRVFRTMRMTVQNVTAADDDSIGTNGLSMDRIDRNPVRFRYMTFGKNFPYLRNQSAEDSSDNQDLFRITDRGVIGGSPVENSEPSKNMTVLPRPSDFMHVKGVASGVIPPGGMKTFTMKFQYDGRIAELIRGLQPKREIGAWHSFGNCGVMFCTKVMDTGGEDIKLNVGYNTVTGAYIKKNYGPPTNKYVVYNTS